jgi:ElaB/YqjD/DUF883 family membrane-anchored ribosome-binding protein
VAAPLQDWVSVTRVNLEDQQTKCQCSAERRNVVAETLKTKVAVLETEVSKMGELFTKLDTTIDRITDISNSINQMLVVHEQKIQQNSEDTEDLFHLTEKRRIENDEQLRELHSRITTNGKETRQEMNANVIKIMHAISEIKDAMLEREKIIRNEQSGLEKRITDLEKKNWFYMGAAAVIGFLAGAFDWISSIFS